MPQHQGQGDEEQCDGPEVVAEANQPEPLIALQLRGVVIHKAGDQGEDGSEYQADAQLDRQVRGEGGDADQHRGHEAIHRQRGLENRPLQVSDGVSLAPGFVEWHEITQTATGAKMEPLGV